MSHDLLKLGDEYISRLSESELDRAKYLLSVDIDKLFTELALQAQGHGALGDDLAVIGKRLFDLIQPKLVKILCNHRKLRQLTQNIDENNADFLSLAAVVASVIGNTAGATINEMLVAILVLRIGLRKLCKEKGEEHLTTKLLLERWAELNNDVIDPYGGNPEVRRLIIDDKKERPNIIKACQWLQSQAPQFKEFFTQNNYDWALEPDSFELGTEAHWQVRILQQMERLHRIYNDAKQEPLPMSNVVVRQTFITSYGMMSPRYLPYKEIHFIIMPQSYLECAFFLWRAMAEWCTEGNMLNEPWMSSTQPVKHQSDPDPSYAILECIARQLADPARDKDIHRFDAAALITRDIPSLKYSINLQEMLNPTVFDNDISLVLADYTLSHELGHRLCEHSIYDQTKHGEYLKVELEADKHAFDLFRASWGWRSELLESTGFDEAGNIALGSIVFFHTIRLRSILVKSIEERLFPGRKKGLGPWDHLQEVRAQIALDTLTNMLDRLNKNGYNINKSTSDRLNTFVKNIVAFGDYIRGVIERLPVEDLRAADEIAKDLV